MQVPAFAMTSTAMRIASSFGFCCFLLYVGFVLREKIAFSRKIMLPAPLIGGVIGLIFVQLCNLNENVKAVVEHDWIIGWSELPTFLMNIIFTTMFMGNRVPGIGEAWKWAGPQLAYGQILAWGNWTVSCFITVVLLTPAYGTHVLFGSIFPIGFEAGHGAAAGYTESFINLGFMDGGDLALTVSTIGMLSGVILGTLICNLGQRQLWTRSSYEAGLSIEEPCCESEKRYNSRIEPTTSELSQEEISMIRDWRLKAVIDPNERKPGSYSTISVEAMESFSLHLAFIGLATFLAYWTKRGLIGVEQLDDWLTEYSFFSGFPLFPLCMIWGLIIQIFVDRFCTVSPLDRPTMERIGGIALDFLILTAIASTRVDAISSQVVAMLILVLVGMAWQLFAFFVLAPMMLPDYWFERGIAELGKSMGTTATGIMLLQMVDPNHKTTALKAFTCKQMLHEPFMGGGIWTSLALPLVVSLGNWGVFGISVGFIAFWLIIWFVFFRRLKEGPMVQYKYNPVYN